MKLIHLSCILGLTAFAQAQAPKFELRDGDRVLLLGDALLERENTLGYLEARMHAAWPTTKFTVRNLSWAGDTPKGWSRASFDGPAKGYERLKEQIALVKPTVVFLGYGMAASLQEMTDLSNDIMLNRDAARYGEEPMSAARFKKELGELMTDIEAIGEKPRFVLLSPIKHEDLRKARPGMTDPTKHNELLAQYSKNIEELAKERGARFVNLAGKIINTQNGIHLTNDGFSSFAQQLAEQLGGAPESKLLRPREDYLLAAVLRKNDLFFHRTRPANSTYLFGFRKHEQGRNAVEIPQFDPLVEKEDAEIIEVKTTPKGAVPSFLRGSGMESDWLAREAGVKIPAVVVPSAEDTATKDDGQSAVLSLALIGDKPVVALNGSTLKSIDEIPEALKKLKPTRVVVRADSNVKYSVAKEVLRHVEVGGVMKITFSVTDNKKVAERLPIPNFTTEEGYEITLWADTNLVGKPVGMNWDAAGRLWVACSPVYPQIKPGAHPEDKVVVIEDTDKDGKGDKSTTFATNLLIAAGVAPDFSEVGNWWSNSGEKAKLPADRQQLPIKNTPNAAYVGASTELVHVTDTDGDGKADQRRVVLSGFGTEDTHHTIHTLKWGPDGRLYFNQSIYIHSHLETPYGMVRVNSGAIMAYDPRTERTEVIAKGWCNPWGHVWDEWGQQFTTDGAGGQGISWLVQGAMYFTYENARKIMPSVSPGSYPKFCGLEIVRSPLFPAEWQGNFITCDFRAHRIARFSMKDLSPAKSGYETKAEADLVRTTDSSFRPIDVKTGPDGALYVADWTNPVINHGEVDFRDPRRDHVNGRIWRIAPKGKALKWGEFTGAKTPPMPEGRDPKLAAQNIKSQKPRVRVEAMRALCKTPSVENAALVLEAAVNGGSASALPAAPGGQFANSAAAADADTHYAYAAWLSVNDLAPQVMEYVEKLAADPASAAKQQAAISFALQALPSAKTGPLLSKIVAKNGAPKDGPWIELIGQAGGPAEAEKLLAQIAEPRAAAALIAAARRGVKPPGASLDVIKSAPAAVKADALRLAGLWKLDAVEFITASMNGASQPVIDASFDALATLRTPAAATTLEALLAKGDAGQRRRALEALATFKPDSALAGLSAVAADGDAAS